MKIGTFTTVKDLDGNILFQGTQEEYIQRLSKTT